MMLSTVNTATNNGNFTNNTVMYHDEENAHITDWQLKPIETTENDPSAPNSRKTEKSTKNSKPTTHSADTTSTFGMKSMEMMTNDMEMMAKSFARTAKNMEKTTKNIEKMLAKLVEASSPGRYTVAASTETAKIYEHAHNSNQTLPRKRLKEAYPTETTLPERLQERLQQLEESSVRAKWASTRVEETINRNKEKLEASRKQNKEFLERQTNEFLARQIKEEAKTIWYSKHARSHIRDDNSLNMVHDMEVMTYDNNEENDDDPRTPEQQKIYELFYTSRNYGGQMRTGNVKRDDLHAHEYEQYLKPYEESEGDSTKMTLKVEELGVYIDDLNQTKQAEE